MVAYVYRLFDADGALLYIGLTNNIDNRLVHHKCDKPWFSSISCYTLERFPNRGIARFAECIAIRDEGPIFNIADKTVPTEQYSNYQRSKLLDYFDQKLANSKEVTK